MKQKQFSIVRKERFCIQYEQNANQDLYLQAQLQIHTYLQRKVILIKFIIVEGITGNNNDLLYETRRLYYSIFISNKQ